MGIRDSLRGAGRVAAAVVADALQDWALDDLEKAKRSRPGDFATDEGPESAPGGSDQDTSKDSPVPTEMATQDPKSMFFDPFAVIEQMGFKERKTNISYGTLRAMAWKMPVVQAIIQTRINQIASFCRPQRDRYSMGYKIQLRDPEQKPTAADKKWAAQASNLILRTGVTENPRGRDNFEKFVRRLAWDSYVYDQTAFEVVPNRKDQPAEWYAVDAATIRLADSPTTFIDENDLTAIRYVQVYDGLIVAEFNQEEMGFGVRNPRTDIRNYGYGVSELEMLVTTITNLLWGFDYNRNAFKQGSVHKGMLNFKGAISEKSLKAFRRFWYAQLAGVENSWRTPITNADDVQWISMHQGNRDMEYNAWIDFNIKVACGIYSIDPSEINFKYGNSGQKNVMNEASNKDKIIESKERGLRPMLRFLSDLINRFIIWPMNESFEFEFVGLDARTPEQISDLNQKLVKTVRTVDELRAEDDLEPLPDGKGEIILDPTWLQWAQSKEMAQQGGGEGEGGFPGAPGGGAAPEGGEEEEGGPSPEELDRMLGGGEEEEEPEETEKSLRRRAGRLVKIDLRV